MADADIYSSPSGGESPCTVSHICSPRCSAQRIMSMSCCSVLRDSERQPGFAACPTKMQPAVSFTVFPAWMRIPSKPFTPMSSGSQLLKRGECVTTSRYRPYGIAVNPFFLRRRTALASMSCVSCRSGGSNVSHSNHCPLTAADSRPSVYWEASTVLVNVSSIA